MKKVHAEYYTGLRNGLWDGKHVRAMGPAVWLFGWLISRQTTQNGSLGLVLGGRPVPRKEISEALGVSNWKVEEWSARLRRTGYIETEQRAEGLVYRIRNAKKAKWRQPALFEGSEKTPRVGENAEGGVGENTESGGLYLLNEVLKRNHTRKSNREGSRKSGARCDVALPSWIPVETWKNYLEMRKKIRRPMTERAKVLAVECLERLKAEGHDPQQILEQSILNSWQGLFPLRAKVGGYGPANRAEQRVRSNIRAVEQARELLRRGKPLDADVGRGVSGGSEPATDRHLPREPEK